MNRSEPAIRVAAAGGLVLVSEVGWGGMFGGVGADSLGPPETSPLSSGRLFVLDNGILQPTHGFVDSERETWTPFW